MILPFPFEEPIGQLGSFDDAVPDERKKLIMRFYHSCLQRHLYGQPPGKRLLSKNVSFAPMVAALIETFPDGKIICNVRHPLESVPSHISAMTAGAALFGNDHGATGLRDQMIDLQRYAFSHVAEVLPKLPANRYAFVRMEDLKADVHHEITAVYERLGYTLSAHFEDYLKREKLRERDYASGHRYALATYELGPEAVTRRFADILDVFGYDGTS
jgi:hypothetical protein